MLTLNEIVKLLSFSKDDKKERSVPTGTSLSRQGKNAILCRQVSVAIILFIFFSFRSLVSKTLVKPYLLLCVAATS